MGTESFKTTIFEMLKADYSDTFVAKDFDPLSLKKLQSFDVKACLSLNIEWNHVGRPNKPFQELNTTL